MSSRIDLRLYPSVSAGLIATLPWLALLTFALTTAAGTRPWMLALAPVSVAGAILHYRRFGLLLGKRPVTGLALENGQLQAILPGREAIPVRPCRTSRLGPMLTLLKLRPSGSRLGAYYLILLAPEPWPGGNVCPDQFRRLRQWLRLGQSQSSN
ncbi:MAG: hypothetical protein R6W86_06870 [Marinobacter sp.]|uniref:hypothetical protein n=1 Tax=Marinobacter sp. TaxID=50741 RepID=UPI00396E6FEA